MSTNSPLSFTMTLFYSGIYACKYYPGTSNIATSYFFIVMITSVVISASVENVGDDVIFPSSRNRFFLLPSAHINPLIFALIFCLTKLTASSAPHLSLGVMPYGLMVPKTGFNEISPLLRCLYDLNMAATNCDPNFLIPNL